jgi:hypothetical protein
MLFIEGVAAFAAKKGADGIVEALLGKTEGCYRMIMKLQYEIVKLAWDDEASSILQSSIPVVAKSAFDVLKDCAPVLFKRVPVLNKVYKLTTLVVSVISSVEDELVYKVKQVYVNCADEKWKDCGENVADVAFTILTDYVLRKREANLLNLQRDYIVPDGWTCSPSFYNQMDGCDCMCGVQDPDCNLPDFVYGCYDGASPLCINGQCQYSPPPAAWACDPSYYDAHDGCDCECGVADPDCNYTSQVLLNCPEDVIATCEDGICIAAEVPPSWICPPKYYGTQDGCDCYCGADDPDCSIPDQHVYGCPCDSMQCDKGLCSGVCSDKFFMYTSTNSLAVRKQQLKDTGRPHSLFPRLHDVVLSPQQTAPVSWVCPIEFYAANDGCDCSCGDFDPDCTTQPFPVYGCESGVNAACAPDGSCQYTGAVPSGWTCSPWAYNSGDACDCGCGAWDPDCDTSTVIDGCAVSQLVSCSTLTNNCEYAEDIPDTWVCPVEYYHNGDGCHCNCGAVDPDCVDTPNPVLNCPCSGMTCSDGFCTGVCFNMQFTQVAAVCGDGSCTAGEAYSCPEDCPSCGDGVCSSIESCSSCAGDCCQYQCAPGCSNIDLENDVCDEACNTASCSFDFEVCYCAEGCPPSYVGDKYCDLNCNVPQCYYDDGDCDYCNPKCPSLWLGDGECDDYCNNEECHYDNGDCQSNCACPYEYLGDGVCDSECDVKACSYDNGDCQGGEVVQSNFADCALLSGEVGKGGIYRPVLWVHSATLLTIVYVVVD